MQTRFSNAAQVRPSLPFILLAVLLTVLCLAGGASVPDVSGQAIVRFVAATVIVVAILFCGRPAFQAGRAPLWLLLACVGLAAAQLVPLPPALWQALPGRAFLGQLTGIEGQGAIWRPWSITPSLTLNALMSLLVPAATLFLLLLLPERERLRLPGMVLVLILAATLIGLLQFSGRDIQSPFVNRSYDVSGPFANRNHFALLLACGCLVAPTWAVLDRKGSVWRSAAAIGLTVLFLLAALGSGSRAGFAFSLLALPLAVLLLQGRIRGQSRRMPKWAFVAAIAAAVALVVAFVALAILAGRGASITRALALDAETDLRFRTLPVVFELVRSYFPFGSGMGSFDLVFRMNEPFDLLKRTYFNRAHNDFLEVVINGGIFGALLIAAALVWWLRASIRVWRARAGSELLVARLGSAILLILLLASLVDYAARTPIMMAIIMIAAVWLNFGVIEHKARGQTRGSDRADVVGGLSIPPAGGRRTLPRNGQRL